MNFSEVFSNVLAQSNITIYTLAKTTGIDRRAIYRLKDGTKKSTFEEFSKIVKALPITKETADRLWRAYEISSVGEEKFYSRERTKEFLETLSSIYDSKNENVVMLTKSEIDLTEESTTLQGKTNINNFIRNVMSLENATNGFIYIQSDLSFDFIFNELAFQINYNRSLETKIFISLKSAEKSVEKNFYTDSILSISKIYPLLLIGENLEAKYVKVTSNSNSLFPHNIVTSHYLISISQDKKSAIITKANKIIQSTKQIFCDVFPNGKNFVTRLNLDESILHIMDSLFKQNKSKTFTLYSMDYEPCVTVLSDKYILESSINKENPEAVKLIEMYSSIYSQNHVNLISNFTLDGLRSFLNTGILFGIPKDYYTPLNEELRIRIIKNMCGAYKKGIYTPHLINSANFTFPKNFRYSGSGTIYDYFFITLTDKDDMFNTLSLNESGLSMHFYDFVQSLPETNLVFSTEESMQIIVDETEKILNCKIDFEK